MAFPTTPPRTKAIASAIPVLLLTAAAFGIHSAPAHAGDYTVPYCKTASGSPSPVFDWSIVNNLGNINDAVINGCGDGSDVMGANWNTNGPRPAGAVTGWVLNTVNGLHVVHWTSAGGVLNEATAGAVDQVAGWAADGVSVGQCAHQLGCSGQQAVNVDANLYASTLAFTLACGGTCSGFASMRAFSNIVTYNDPVGPTGTASSAVFGSGFGNPIGGVVPATISASDQGSGVQYFSVQIDGQQVSRTQDQCAAPFTKMQPCSSGYSSILNIPTGPVSDGTHTVAIVAYDASGNATVLQQGPVVIQNGSAVGPGSDSNLRGAINGSNGGDDAAKVELWWPNTAKKASTKKSVVRSCKKSKAYVKKHPILCNGKPPQGILTHSYSSKKTNQVAGRLTSADGTGIAGATLDLSRQASAAGVAPSSLGQVTTDATGRWSAPVAIAAGSAGIVASYRTHARDTTSRVGQAKLRVRGLTTIKVSHSKTKPGRRVKFAGGMVGKTGNRGRISVALQVHYRGRWRTFATPTTSSRGKWAFTYRFSRNSKGTYRFRARPRTSGAYPYSAGTSSTRTVRVR